MAKAVAPSIIDVPGIGKFSADAMPDPFDERDLEYRPRLEPLPPMLDQRTGGIVLKQVGSSCTGHSMAAVINTVLARQAGTVAPVIADDGTAVAPPVVQVSPYMLYRLGRRYDEFAGEADEGSSLRGVFKGWFHHGVALREDWPDLEMEHEPDLDDEGFVLKCKARPLGAFYRVNPYRLDDMQSAINELNAIAVSGIIHDGWLKPVEMTLNGRVINLIARQVNSQTLGGHAFAFVGYNEVGFLVQNSWGTEWGKGGFATLPYEDWLDCAYDAWVARPGVPNTPFVSGRNHAAIGTSGNLATAPEANLRRLSSYVVNLDNDGLLSSKGKFVSTPKQIDDAFNHMRGWHDKWVQEKPGTKRHIVLYAHGGLVSEANGLDTAQKHLNWWLNNGVYPLYFAWQSGPVETLVDQLTDLTRGRIPFGGIGFDFVEQFDRFVEKFSRSNVRWMWDEMKENARGASKPIGSRVQWPPSPQSQEAMGKMPGGTLTVTRLKRYIDDVGAGNVRVHLVGHSAGAIFHAALLPQLVRAGISVDSLSLLAPAIRVDEWERDMLPHLQSGAVRRFSTFAMSDQRELDDTVGTNHITPYHKSLLYLVSRALERPVADGNGKVPTEVPLLGMARFFDGMIGSTGKTLHQTISGIKDSEIVFSRADTPDDARSDSDSHGGFDDDAPTMTSVLMRALQVKDSTKVQGYQANAALRTPDAAPALATVVQPPVVKTPKNANDGEAQNGRASSMKMAVDVNPPGQEPVVEVAPPQTQRPVAPDSSETELLVEVAEAPRTGSTIVDVLEHSGWTLGNTAAQDEEVEEE